MKIQEIRAIAKRQGVNSARLKKPDLIRAIQRGEGNFPCFGSALDGHCDQPECLWRNDCLPAEAPRPDRG